jgi:hypothetical protein
VPVAFFAVVSIGVIGLYVAFAIPIALRIKAGSSFEHGAWSLGDHYKWINPIAVAWIALITILFLMPTVPAGIPWHSSFNWNVVNYAPITLGGVLLAVALWWVVSARKWFKGPVAEGTEADLARIEAQYGGREAAPSSASA